MIGFIQQKLLPRRCREIKISVSHGLDVVAGQRLPGRVLSVDWSRKTVTNETSVVQENRGDGALCRRLARDPGPERDAPRAALGDGDGVIDEKEFLAIMSKGADAGLVED